MEAQGESVRVQLLARGWADAHGLGHEEGPWIPVWLLICVVRGSVEDKSLF